MDIETLGLFKDVSNRLSFAAVAEDRTINPSSVSRAIGHLESELGVRLFHRTTRSMALTEAGTNFLRHVSIILDEIDQAKEEAQSSRIGPMGTLRMTASVTFGERIIMPLVPVFRATYPNVKLEFMFTDTNLDYAGEGIDLGVRLGAKLQGDLFATKLLDTRYRVCASPDYLSTAPTLDKPADLAAHSCAVFNLPAFRISWLFRDKKGLETTVPISGDVVASSALNLRTAALSGIGPALLPDWLIRDDLEDRRLIDLFPEYSVTATSFDTAAWLLYPYKSYLPHKVRVMIDYLKTNIARPRQA